MTTSTEEQPTTEAPAADAPLMHEKVREEAEELIRSLAAVAGDESGVYRELALYARGKSVDTALGGSVAALVLIFAECITTPTEPGEFTELTYPTD